MNEYHKHQIETRSSVQIHQCLFLILGIPRYQGSHSPRAESSTIRNSCFPEIQRGAIDDDEAAWKQSERLYPLFNIMCGPLTSMWLGSHHPIQLPSRWQILRCGKQNVFCFRSCYTGDSTVPTSFSTSLEKGSRRPEQD